MTLKSLAFGLVPAVVAGSAFLVAAQAAPMKPTHPGTGHVKHTAAKPAKSHACGANMTWNAKQKKCMKHTSAKKPM